MAFRVRKRFGTLEKRAPAHVLLVCTLRQTSLLCCGTETCFFFIHVAFFFSGNSERKTAKYNPKIRQKVDVPTALRLDKDKWHTNQQQTTCNGLFNEKKLA